MAFAKYKINESQAQYCTREALRLVFLGGRPKSDFPFDLHIHRLKYKSLTPYKKKRKSAKSLFKGTLLNRIGVFGTMEVHYQHCQIQYLAVSGKKTIRNPQLAYPARLSLIHRATGLKLPVGVKVLKCVGIKGQNCTDELTIPPQRPGH